MHSFTLDSVIKYQNRRDVREFTCSDNSTSSSIGNELQTSKLRGRKTKKERVALVKSRMNKTDSNNNCSIVA